MIRAIVLDFDGVIVESLGIKTQAFRDLFSDYPQHLGDIMSYHLSHTSILRYIKFEYIKTRKGEYGPVEDIHLILAHLVTTYLGFKLREG